MDGNPLRPKVRDLYQPKGSRVLQRWRMHFGSRRQVRQRPALLWLYQGTWICWQVLRDSLCTAVWRGRGGLCEWKFLQPGVSVSTASMSFDEYFLNHIIILTLSSSYCRFTSSQPCICDKGWEGHHCQVSLLSFKICPYTTVFGFSLQSIGLPAGKRGPGEMICNALLKSLMPHPSLLFFHRSRKRLHWKMMDPFSAPPTTMQTLLATVVIVSMVEFVFRNKWSCEKEPELRWSMNTVTALKASMEIFMLALIASTSLRAFVLSRTRPKKHLSLHFASITETAIAMEAAVVLMDGLVNIASLKRWMGTKL